MCYVKRWRQTSSLEDVIRVRRLWCHLWVMCVSIKKKWLKLIFERSWQPKQVPYDCKKTNITHIFEKEKRRIWGSPVWAQPHSPGGFWKHVKDEVCLGKPARIFQAETMLDQGLAFYGEKITFMDTGRGVYVIYLDFHKAYATLSNSVLTVLLVKYSFSELHWLYFLAQKLWISIGNWINDQL